mgnify:CR=1 FL=1
MYTLYSDKQNIFECDIQLEGARLDEASVRLIIESPTLNIMYDGSITSDGNCKISMPRLKGLISESGNIKLEVIADDMYFNPWESEYDIVTTKKVTVEVKQPKKPIIVESNPGVKVNILSNNQRKPKQKVNESINDKKRTKVLTKNEIQQLLSKLR